MKSIEENEFDEIFVKPRRNRREAKRYINWMAKRLAVGAYAFGCRGHAGIVVKKIIRGHSWQEVYCSDVEIKSLVDGGIESCSVWHCAPEPLEKDFAIEYTAYMMKHGEKMATLKYFPESYKHWEAQYNDPTTEFDEYRKGKTLQDYLGLNDTEFKAFESNSPPTF